MLNISVWDLTPKAYMTRLNFTQEEKDWAALLYSVIAEDQSTSVSDTDGSGYYGTDYGDITFTNAETPVVYYNQTDARWGNKPYGKTSTIGRAGCRPTALAIAVAWRDSTQAWLPIKNIVGGVAVTRDNRFIKILEVLPRDD